MPTYQYRCTDCGRDLEVVQKFSDASLTECPTCAGSLRKVFNAVGVVFKGSGFYRTDSRAAANGDSPNGKAKNGAEKSTEKSDSSSTDSKPASSPSAGPDSSSGATAGSGSSSSSGSGSGSKGSASSTGAKTAAR